MFKIEEVETDAELQHAAHMHYMLMKMFREDMNEKGLRLPELDDIKMEDSKEIISNSPHTYLIYNDENHLIGFFALTLEASEINSGISVIITSMYVFEEYRGKGAGHAAIEVIKEIYPHYHIEVSRKFYTSKCKAFLKSEGFIPVKVQYIL